MLLFFKAIKCISNKENVTVFFSKRNYVGQQRYEGLLSLNCFYRSSKTMTNLHTSLSFFIPPPPPPPHLFDMAFETEQTTTTATANYNCNGSGCGGGNSSSSNTAVMVTSRFLNRLPSLSLPQKKKVVVEEEP